MTKLSRTDIAVALARGVVGAVPALGPLAAELVGVFVPNQRIDRVEDLVAALADRTAELEGHAPEHINSDVQDSFRDFAARACGGIEPQRRREQTIKNLVFMHSLIVLSAFLVGKRPPSNHDRHIDLFGAGVLFCACERNPSDAVVLLRTLEDEGVALDNYVRSAAAVLIEASEKVGGAGAASVRHLLELLNRQTV